MRAVFTILSLIIVCGACSPKMTISDSHKDSPQLTEEQIFNITSQPKDFPLVLRRTTLIVRDIETSLNLYKDALGMEIIYDNILTRPRKDGKPGEQKLRLVFLKATHEFYGVLGLLEYYYGEEREEKPVRREGFTAQNIVLLFNSHDVKAKFAEITKISGIEVVESPKHVEYPGYDGKSKIKVLVSTFYDPDGFLVEFNELLDDL